MKKRYGLAIVLIALCGLMVFKFTNVDPDKKKILDEIKRVAENVDKDYNIENFPYLTINNKECLNELYNIIKYLEKSDLEYIDDSVRPRFKGSMLIVGENLEIYKYSSHLEIIFKKQKFKSGKNYVRYKLNKKIEEYLLELKKSPKTKDLDEEVN